jgi:hypothetical protein
VAILARNGERSVRTTGSHPLWFGYGGACRRP